MSVHRGMASHCAAAVCLCALVLGQPLEAATFDDRAAFLAAVDGTTLIDHSFETPFAESPTVTFGESGPNPITLTKTGGGASGLTSTDNVPRLVSDGLRAVNVYDASPPVTQIVTLSFAHPVHAFGIDIKDFGTAGAGSLDVDSPGVLATASLATATPNRADGNLIFFGLTSAPPITSVRFTWPTGFDGTAFDNANYTIPEPATAALLGLGGTMLLRRTSRKQKRM